jgi:glycosyltransferase domain-containing protein
MSYPNADSRFRDSLSLLTVVVCSYGRPKELGNTLSFFAHFGLRAVVIDGSEKPLSSTLLKPLDSLNITYVHEPTPSLLNRLSVAASLVRTPYVALMFDDEYFLPSALSRAVEFLENNSQYVSCGGQAIGFGPGLKKGQLMWSEFYPNHRGFTLSEKNPLDRVVKHLSDYRMASYCSVVRTRSWSAAWSEIARRQFLPYGVQELQFECAMSFSGYMHMLPDLFWLRNLEVPSIKNVGVKGLDDRLPFYVWWRKVSTKSDRNSFVEVMASVLNRIRINSGDNLNLGEISKYIYLGFARYSLLIAKETKRSNNHLRHLLNKARGLLLVNKAHLQAAEENTPKSFLPIDSSWDPTELSEVTSRIVRAFHQNDGLYAPKKMGKRT